MLDRGVEFFCFAYFIFWAGSQRIMTVILQKILKFIPLLTCIAIKRDMARNYRQNRTFIFQIHPFRWKAILLQSLRRRSRLSENDRDFIFSGNFLTNSNNILIIGFYRYFGGY